MVILFLLLGIHIINPTEQAGQSLDYTTPCTLQVETEKSFRVILPVRAAHWNLNQNQGEHGLGVDTLTFETIETGETTIIFPNPGNIFPNLGTFYITTTELPDTTRTPEPPHRTIPNTVQISVRPDNTYTGYLFELINTPFIMAPRTTPLGYNQADERLGTDCAGLAVYGRRRMGETTLRYLGPRGILDYLEPVNGIEYHNEGGIYISEAGDTASAPEAGEIVHFGGQVSVFLEDRGIQGVLDSEDLLIQSWFDGTHVCAIEESGFRENPLKLYRWRD